MTRIILSGALGKMGKAITACVENRNDCEIVAGVDLATAECTFPIFKSFNEKHCSLSKISLVIFFISSIDNLQ